MPPTLNDSIITLKQKMLGPDSPQVVSEEDLVLFNSLIYSEDVEIEALKKIDQELYKELIVKLVHQRTDKDNSKQLLSLVFYDLAGLHEKLADLTPEQDSEEVKHFTLSSHHKKLKYYTDSATFLQYSLLNSENKDGIENEIYSKLSAIEEKILSVTGNANTKTCAEKVKFEAKHYKNILGELRSECIAKLELAEDKGNEQTETVQSVFEYTTDKMKGFLKKIYENTIGELEQKPPCKFAILGLGSMALKQITPWSDLEFAIILEDYTPEAVKYFRDLSHLVNFKMINLGETIIPTSKYKMDMSGFGKVGVNFDLGGKTPLGRIGGDKPYDLIGTKDWLMWYVKNENNKATNIDKNLPYILENVARVCGDVDLVEAYQKDVADFIHQDYEGEEDKYKDQGLKNHQIRAMKILKEGAVEQEYLPIGSLKSNIFKGDLEKLTPSFDSDKEGSLLDVKQEIYRLPDRMIYNLGAYFGVHTCSAWDTIGELAKLKIISEEGATNLRKATDFATSLRLKSYDQSANQTGSISTYIPVLEHLPQEEQDRIIKTTFHVEDKEGIYRFYYTMINLISEIMDISRCKSTEESSNSLAENDFVTTNDYIKGVVYAKFLEYDKAIKYLESNLNQLKLELTNNEECLHLLVANIIRCAALYKTLGKSKETLSKAKELLEIQPKLKEDSNFFLAKSNNILGVAYLDCNLSSKAIEYNKEAIEMLKNEQNTSSSIQQLLAKCFSDLGNAYAAQKKYEASLDSYEESLKLYQNNSANPYSRSIAYLHNNLGLLHNEKHQYDKSIQHLNLHLELVLKIHVNNPNHPDIGNAYISLANAHILCNGNSRNNKIIIDYCNNALKIFNKVYGNTPHIDIANAYHAFGNAYKNTDFIKAIKYFSDALEIYNDISPNESSNSIANCLNDFASLRLRNGKYEEAKKCFEKSGSDKSLLALAFLDALDPMLNIKKNIALDNNFQKSVDYLKSVIKCDPELKYDYHYHSLALFLSAKGDIKEAYNTFDIVWKSHQDKITSAFCVDHAQFLFLNKIDIEAGNNQIARLLYKAIELSDNSVLKYGKVFGRAVIPVIKKILPKEDTILKISPKLTAYHLLITHPEYVKEEDNVVAGFLSFIQSNPYIIHDKLFLKIISDSQDLMNKCQEKKEKIIADDIILDKNVNKRDEYDPKTPILQVVLPCWYSDNEITKLLQAQMPEDKATVLAITQFENKELLEDNLNNALKCIKQNGLPVLMPIHVHGNHWVGAVIRKQSDGKIQVIYNDPKGHSIQDEENIITFIGIIQRHEKDANIIDLQLKQQYNDDDDIDISLVNTDSDDLDSTGVMGDAST